jgi:cholesterol transport system auxiliary component
MMRFKIFFLGSFYCLLAGCSLFGPVKSTAVHKYTFGDTIVTKAVKGQRGENVLLVSTPEASPGYDTADMIYVIKPYQLSTFAKNRWVAAPTAMLMPILMQSLENTGCFKAVVPPSSLGAADLALDTQLLVLQQEFYGDTNQVRVEIELTLTNNETHKVIAHRRFATAMCATQNNPYAGVVATNQAMAALLKEMNSFVCHYGRKLPPTISGEESKEM